MPDSLTSEIMREREEESRWAQEKGRPSPLFTTSSTSDSFDRPSPSMTPIPMQQHPASSPGMDVLSGSGSAVPYARQPRGASPVFLTKYGRNSSRSLAKSDSVTSASPRRSSLGVDAPSKSTFHVVRTRRHTRQRTRALPINVHRWLTPNPARPACLAQATPGPGAYDTVTDHPRRITAVLKKDADKPSPAFRSTSRRFPGPTGKFNTADPIHLEPASVSRPRDMQHFVNPSPVAFRRGGSAVMTSLG